MITIYTFPVADLLADDPEAIVATYAAEVDDQFGVLLGIEQAAKRVEEAAEDRAGDDIMAHADPDLAKPVLGDEPADIVPCS
jgi:hypothetical protein